jgi:hypothetical protein
MFCLSVISSGYNLYQNCIEIQSIEKIIGLSSVYIFLLIMDYVETREVLAKIVKDKK